MKDGISGSRQINGRKHNESQKRELDTLRLELDAPNGPSYEQHHYLDLLQLERTLVQVWVSMMREQVGHMLQSLRRRLDPVRCPL